MKKLCFLLFILITSFSSFSQETTGTLEGKIIDKLGAPIDFATIVITDTETNFKYGSISQSTDFYIVPNIPPGNHYKVQVGFLGFQTPTISRGIQDLARSLSDIYLKSFKEVQVGLKYEL